MLLARNRLVRRGALPDRAAPMVARPHEAAALRSWIAMPLEVRVQRLAEDPDVWIRLHREALRAEGLLARAEALSRYLVADPPERRALIEQEIRAMATPVHVEASAAVDIEPAELATQAAPARRRRTP